MEDFKSLLELEFSPYSSLTIKQLDYLEQHYQLLLRWNPKLNLTRITSLLDAVRYHYCESLYLARSLPSGPLRIVDIGSGAGFPGIPVAIYRPDCEVHLVESHQRKAVFLGEATRNLPNIRVLPVRAEEVTGTYDWMISRAVRPRDVLKLELAQNVFILGTDGDKLPWGESRALFHVEH
jgi:16S rRNA (guanine527-N7)-methyltransferase